MSAPRPERSCWGTGCTGTGGGRGRCRTTCRRQGDLVGADLVGDDVRHRIALRDLGCWARLGHVRPHPVALGPYEQVPHRLVGEVVEPRAGDPVALVGDALRSPDPLGGVDVVDRSEHLGVDALHVVGLGEALGDDLPVAVDRGMGGATHGSVESAHAVLGKPSRNPSGRSSGSGLTNIGRPQVSTSAGPG